jgi:tetratricopeptide (TPR) repeat protein
LAATYSNCGEFDKALSIYEHHLAAHAAQPTIWTSCGHILKTLGRTQEAIDAYRRSLEFAPGLGLAYWSLANLKTFRFSDEEIARMERLLARKDTPAPELVNFHFAMGKAMEDAGRLAEAFTHYSEGARLHRTQVKYDRERTSQSVTNAIEFFSAEFFARKAKVGNRAPDPIFIVGLPRSGSTLVEQILASHSCVEGTMELPNMALIAAELCGYERAAAGGSYLDALGRLDDAAFAALGERYLADTRLHRKLGRAHFIDKTPNNWSLIGLIHLILPNAKIIDARRHPLATCLSCFKQHFALGQNFTYDLTDLGQYYSDYLRLMSHWDRAAPGRVHRVIHEDLVADPETHIRALLAYCGLAFEPACLKPHETDRPVVTASAQQVRQPISAKGLEEWRRFEPWLGPLKQALGQSLETWRD